VAKGGRDFGFGAEAAGEKQAAGCLADLEGDGAAAGWIFGPINPAERVCPEFTGDPVSSDGVHGKATRRAGLYHIEV